MNQPLNHWPLDIKPGDLILTRGDGWLSRSIRWFGRRASGDCRVNHTAIYAGVCERGTPLYLEAQDFGLANELEGRPCVVEEVGKLRIAPLRVYDDVPCIVYQSTQLTDDQRTAMMQLLLPIVGQAYGWGKLPLFALDSLFRTYWFTRLFSLTSFKVCSQAAAWAYAKVANIDFGTGWRSVSPDMQDDWCSRSVYWRTIHDTLPDPKKAQSPAQVPGVAGVVQ